MTIRAKVGLKMGLAALAAVAGSFLSWGPARIATPEDSFARPTYEIGNAWTSSLVVNGVELPNLLPVLVAIVLAVWSVANPRLGRGGLAPVLAVYGTVHGVLAARLPVLGDVGGGFAAGPVVLLVAFVFMLLAMTGVPDEPATASSAL